MNKIHIIVDANPMISALLGGQARTVFHAQGFNFFTTERKIWEVKRYVPMIAMKSRRMESEIFEAIRLLPLTSYQDAFFETHHARAVELIGARDPTDVDLLALALKLGHPIWSHDHDFEQIAEIVVLSTEALLAEITRRDSLPDMV